MEAEMATESRGLLRIIVDGLTAVADFFINLIRNIFRGSSSPSTSNVIKSRFTRDVLRTEDLLVLQFEFINLDLKTTTDAEGNRAAHLVPSADAYIIIKFPPQNIAEEAFFQKAEKYAVQPPDPATGQPLKDPVTGKPATNPDTGTADKDINSSDPAALPPPPVQSRLSLPSRLVFKIPPEIDPIPYELESLLELCGRSRLSVTATALPPPTSRAAIDRSGNNLMRGAFVLNPDLSHTATAQVSLSSAEKLITESRVSMRERVSTAGRIASQSLIIVEPEEKIGPSLKVPTELETAIELPFRLIISPNKYAAWAHTAHLVRSPLTKRVELWHTRLASLVDGKVDELNEWYRTVRAVWTRDPDFDVDKTSILPSVGDDPFRMSLESLDRQNIVHLTSNYHIWIDATKKEKGRLYVPLPVQVKRLMLSSLGGWLDSRGAWLPPHGSGLGVEEWRHVATMGRDHYVRVVYKGFLFPFMHRASLVKITERKFHTGTKGNVAYLRQRMFIIVREPEKLYPPTGLKTPDGKSYDLQWPISRIHLTTLVTPDLNPPEESDYILAGTSGPIESKQAMFWPRVGSADFPFHLIAEDFDGQQVEFTMPLLFVSVLGNLSDNEGLLKMVRDSYEVSPAYESRRRRSMSGKHLMFAPSMIPGDTTYETQFVTFGAEIPSGNDIDALGEDAPRFYPAVRKADVISPSIKALIGNNQTMQIQYAKTYLEEGFTGGNNRGEVFAEIVPGTMPVGLDFNGKGDRSGGLVMPNMSIKGLSRVMGPVSGDNLSQITTGQFDPKDFFKGLNAKIFGVIDLWDVIQGVGLDQGLDLVPRFITEAFTAVEAFLQELDNFKQRLDRIGAELLAKGGAVASLPARLQADFDNLRNQVQELIKSPTANIAAWKTAFIGLLNTFNNDLRELKAALPLLPPTVADEVSDLERIITNFADELQDAAKVAGYVEQLLNALQVPDEMKIRFEWKPLLKSWPASKPLFVASNNGTPATLTIAAEVSAKTNLSSTPKANISCLLRNFSLDLIGNVESFIIIRFGKLEFRAVTGKKPDVDVVMDEIKFVGVLSFVEALKTLIPLDGFSDPPALNVTAEGIDASFSMALPNIAFGVFSLQNLSLGAGFNVPFVGKPLSVRFNFCERQSPFLLTVSLFGGGGFFGITLDPAGVQILEASFEFGASLSVDFGVASGGVYVMAGIYFRLEVVAGGSNKASLTGYLRMGGEVEVLGIISVSIELNLSLTYEFSSGKCTGRATLTIEIDILFFSASVEIEAERKFAGSNGDPTFAQLMEPYADPRTHEMVDPWREYCEAFAEV
jgi:hypothetical protein